MILKMTNKGTTRLKKEKLAEEVNGTIQANNSKTEIRIFSP